MPHHVLYRMTYHVLYACLGWNIKYAISYSAGSIDTFFNFLYFFQAKRHSQGILYVTCQAYLWKRGCGPFLRIFQYTVVDSGISGRPSLRLTINIFLSVTYDVKINEYMNIQIKKYLWNIYLISSFFSLESTNHTLHTWKLEHQLFLFQFISIYIFK